MGAHTRLGDAQRAGEVVAALAAWSGPEQTEVLDAGRVRQGLEELGDPLSLVTCDGSIERRIGVGVLGPYGRSRSGHQLSGEDALDRYRFVRGVRAVGLHPGEIREIIALRDGGETPCGFVVDLIGLVCQAIDGGA